MINALTEIIKKYQINITGVSHFGAHICKEIDFYNSLNLDSINLFEPQKEVYKKLNENVEQYKNVKTYNYALGNSNFKTKIYSSTTYSGVSASVLKPLEHTKYFPKVIFDLDNEIVNVVRYDELEIKNVNFFVIDVQGYELEALKGAEKSLSLVDVIHIEISRKELYESNAKIKDLDIFLKRNNFIRIKTEWWSVNAISGDAIYVKDKFLSRFSILCKHSALIINNSEIVLFIKKFTKLTYIKVYKFLKSFKFLRKLVRLFKRLFINLLN